jgi:hypothetical protein
MKSGYDCYGHSCREHDDYLLQRIEKQLPEGRPFVRQVTDGLLILYHEKTS